MMPLPPVGLISVAPQTLHLTCVAGLSKEICSFPQSWHFTVTNFPLGKDAFVLIA
jgi:hypothetical protein